MQKQPPNKDYFMKVVSFGREIIEICKQLKITPIVYGSLAYFFYTQDQALSVNDIDFLVPESSFSRLMPELDKLKGVRYEKMPYHSIEVFKGDLEIDLDSIEHFLDPRSRETEAVDIEGVTLYMINKEALIDIYQEALDNMPEDKHLDEKRVKYQRKLENLRNS